MKINLLVLYSCQPKELHEQYAALGLSFHHHQHGNGPLHYSATCNDLTFEIYPLDSDTNTCKTVRIGLKIDDYSNRIQKIHENWEVISPAKITPWGKRILLRDYDQNVVELYI